MLDWNASGLSTDDIPVDPKATAYMLHILGREAAAVCRTYGYDEDKVPTEEELEEYLTSDPLHMPWENYDIIRAISETLNYGNNKEMRDGDGEKRMDLDTIELKKN